MPQYLEGGCNTQVTVAETASLPKVNVISKRDFAQLDRFVREKPNTTSLAIESFITLGNNQTVAWLAAKSTEERGAILQAAQALVPRHKQLAKTRKTAIHQHKVEELDKAKEKAEKRDQRHIQGVQQLTAALTTAGGLWTTVEQMLTFLSSVTGITQRRNAMKCQLRFRKKSVEAES